MMSLVPSLLKSPAASEKPIQHMCTRKNDRNSETGRLPANAQKNIFSRFERGDNFRRWTPPPPTDARGWVPCHRPRMGSESPPPCTWWWWFRTNIYRQKNHKQTNKQQTDKQNKTNKLNKYQPKIFCKRSKMKDECKSTHTHPPHAWQS